MTALQEVERVLAAGGDADDVLRRAVALLHEELGRFVRISFVEGAVGPSAGEPTETTPFSVVFAGNRVAELEVGGELGPEDRALLERIAVLLSPYALVGWDTGGEEWRP